MKKNILFMIINMNIGGTEKALLNMIAEINPDEYNVTLLMLEEYGGFLEELPRWISIKYLDGYNKTLNDLMKNDPGFTELATINETDAIYALQDINMAINRLKAMRNLHEINTGNKLNAQNHASVNKNLIIISVILTSGVSGMFFYGEVFSGVSLALVLGILLNLILKESK